jgi:hypothetical protein
MPEIKTTITGLTEEDAADIFEDAAIWNGYQIQITNPDFDGEIPESDINPRMIDNPQTPKEFLQAWFGNRIISDAKMQQKKEAKDTAESNVDTNFPEITIA